jgi:uncharacterized protein (DUF2267 family)
MVSSTETFIAHVAAHGGIPPERAEVVTRSVLARIGTSLTPEHRRKIADELPPALGAALMAPEVMVDDAMTVHQRELIAAVYRVLAEELSREAIEWLHAELPRRMAEQLVAGAAPVAEPPLHGRNLATGSAGSDRPVSETNPHASRDTLAEGRPGSKRPISERRR